MKPNQKGSLPIIIAAIIVLTVGFYLFRNRTIFPSPYQNTQQQQQTPASTNQGIQSDSDLMSTSNNPDTIDIDAVIDSTLSQNDVDSNSF